MFAKLFTFKRSMLEIWCILKIINRKGMVQLKKLYNSEHSTYMYIIIVFTFILQKVVNSFKPSAKDWGPQKDENKLVAYDIGTRDRNIGLKSHIKLILTSEL